MNPYQKAILVLSLIALPLLLLFMKGMGYVGGDILGVVGVAGIGVVGALFYGLRTPRLREHERTHSEAARDVSKQ